MLNTYTVGHLPITVESDMDAIPDSTLSGNEIPLPLPPKLAEEGTDNLPFEHTKECEYK